jgi:hypothetical protein
LEIDTSVFVEVGLGDEIMEFSIAGVQSHRLHDLPEFIGSDISCDESFSLTSPAQCSRAPIPEARPQASRNSHNTPMIGIALDINEGWDVATLGE